MSVYSMTGFSSVEGTIGEQRVRLEMKALNHRFLDIKVRLPREYAGAEIPLRNEIQSRIHRGSIEIKLEKMTDAGESSAPPPLIHTHLALAAHYYEALVTLQKTLGLSDPIRTLDIASFPDVITRSASDLGAQEAWNQIQPIARKGLDQLLEARKQEGAALLQALHSAVNDMENSLSVVREQKNARDSAYHDKIRARVRAVFEAFPLVSAGGGQTENAVQSVLDSRISQELALLLDRTDIEEELVRFKGHLEHCRRVLEGKGPVGRKLDFILQEMNREINTLGNKAQDFSMSGEVVQVKVRLEQMREQVMNLE